MRLSACVTLVAILLSTGAVSAGLRWPVEPDDEDHHLMSTFEYKDRTTMGVTAYYFHPGIDIFAEPTDSIIAITESSISEVGCDEVAYPKLTRGCSTFLDNGCWVFLSSEDGSGYTFTYGHLDCVGYDIPFMDAYENYTDISASDPIGTIAAWDQSCGGPDPNRPNHLHFEVFDPGSGLLISPTRVVAPWGKLEPPTIDEVHFGSDDVAMTTGPWSVFPEAAVSGTCQAVHGDVDVVVAYTSRYRPLSKDRPGDNLGARFVRWRACGGADPDCTWPDAYDWNSMDSLWGENNLVVEAAYSLIEPWVSVDSFVCDDDVFYAIPTNVAEVGGRIVPDRAGAWSTVSAAVPTADAQHFTVTAEVQDFAGATATRTIPVCVSEEAGPGVAKLLVRDCEDDDGSEPSPCDIWTASPDITLQTATSPPSSSVTVCMRNIGNAAIPAMVGSAPSTVRIEVRADPWKAFGSWTSGPSTSPGSITSATPLFLSLPVTVEPRIDLLTTRLGGFPPGPDWQPGEERCATIAWPPLQSPFDWSISVSVSRSADTPNTHSAVRYDNNRAEAGLHFAYTRIPFQHLKHWDIRIPPSPADSLLVETGWSQRFDTQIHVGPGAAFGEVEGGVLIGFMTDTAHREWTATRPLLPGDSGLELQGGRAAPLDIGARTDVWRVITVAPGTDVSIRGLALNEPTLVSVFAWRRDALAAETPPDLILRLFESGVDGRPPVEVFQRVFRE